jgi:hypothetical protein
MTLKSRIMALHDGKRTTREIADLVYGAPASPTNVTYVRVVIRQRKGAGTSRHDVHYQDRLDKNGSRKQARAAAARAYRKARRAGQAVGQANVMRVRAYMRVLRETARSALEAQGKVAA